MMQTIVFADLQPNIQNIIEYIAAAACGGVIGNRTDSWFMSLFYHQRKRLINWVYSWNPDINDIKLIVDDENYRMVFSRIIADISNEIYDKKLLLWPEITDSIFRQQDVPFDKKQYFISLYNRLDLFSLKYLAALYFHKEIDYFQVFNESGLQPDTKSNKHHFFLGQLQCSTTGLTDMTRIPTNKFFLTELGNEFINFISDESKSKLRSFISE